MNDVLRNETRDREEAAPPAQTAAVARARELADIAAQSAKYAGVNVTVTPCPEVVIQLGSPPQPIRCLGVQFDREYLLVLLPTAGWRALKIDPATRTVVLRLRGWGGFRRHVVRILTCLIYDRLKAQRDQFEPRIEVLRHPEAPLEVSSDLDPPVYPDLDRFSRASSQPGAPSAPSASDANRVPAASPKAPAPSETTLPLEPTVPVLPETPPRSGEPKRPQATTEGKARPLSGRVRR